MRNYYLAQKNIFYDSAKLFGNWGFLRESLKISKKYCNI